MNSAVSVLIVEDESTLASKLAHDVSSFGYRIAGRANTFETALNFISNHHFDIALLDVHLNGRSCGIELGKVINQTCKKPFIFMTADDHDEEVMNEGIAAVPSAFLCKPVMPASLRVSIHQAVKNDKKSNRTQPAENASNEENFFFVKQANRFKKLLWRDVICLRSERNYTNITTNTNEIYLIRNSLVKTLQATIPTGLARHFVQINRSQAVNINYVDEIIDDLLRINTLSFSITGEYGRKLREHLNIIL